MPYDPPDVLTTHGQIDARALRELAEQAQLAMGAMVGGDACFYLGGPSSVVVPSPAGSTGSSEDHKVAVSGTDTMADFLGAKIAAGDNITITLENAGGDEVLVVSAADGLEDHKVRVSGTDTTADYLQPKIQAGTNITVTLEHGGGNEDLKIATVASPTFTDVTVTGTLIVGTLSVTSLAVTSLTVGGVPVNPLEVENVDASEVTFPCDLLQCDNTDGRIQTTDLGGGSAELSWMGLDLVKGTTEVGPQPNLELIEGDNVQITVGEDNTNKRVQATIKATCGLEVKSLSGGVDESPTTLFEVDDGFGLDLASPAPGTVILGWKGEILQVLGTDYGPEPKMRVEGGPGIVVAGADDPTGDRTILTITNSDPGSSAPHNSATEYTGTTTSSAATVFDVSDANGLLGGLVLKNTGPAPPSNQLSYTLTATDFYGATRSTTAGLAALATVSFSLLANFTGSGTGTFPFKRLQLTVQDLTPGSHANYDIWLVLAN